MPTKTPREVIAEFAAQVCGKRKTMTIKDRAAILEKARLAGIISRSASDMLRDLGYTMPLPLRQQPTVLKLIETAFKKAAEIRDQDALRQHKLALIQALAKETDTVGIPAPSWNVVTQIARDSAWPPWPNLGGQRNEADAKRQQAVKAMREFAKIYNDYKTCPLMHDLLRVLYPGDAVKDKPKALKRQIEAYGKFRKAHPDLQLAELVVRKVKDGSVIGIPEGVREQLAEFQIDVKKVKEAKGLIVTSAQYGATLNAEVFEAFKRYAAHLGYVLVVMPIKYGPIKTVHQKETDRRVLLSTFDERLKGYMLFEEHTVAGGLLTLNVIRLRPTLTRFLSDPICERGGNASQIFAAPKLELEYRPRLLHDYPKAIMTTGAVTHPDYKVDNLGQQDRTGELARAEHTFAAILVEFSAAKTFHFRQLLANTKGEFYDIDPVNGGATLVTPRSIEHRPDDVSAVALGDWHVGKTHPDVRRITFEDMLPKLKPKHVILHDLFDGDSMSHWEERQASRRAYKGALGTSSVQKELDDLVAELEWMRKRLPGAALHVVASNHNEFLRQWIEDMRWVRDNPNLAIGAKLFNALQEDMKERGPAAYKLSPMDPVNWWINKQAPWVKTHGRTSKLILPEGPKAKKILCSLHGDIGPRGQKAGGMLPFRKWNQWIIIGHDHSAGIMGPVWRVGTSTHLTDHYVSGPATNWTHTHAVVYANGQRQLINIVNGTYHGRRKLRPKSAGLVPEGSKAKATKKKAAKQA
jgi:hypothetical protein